MKKILFALLLFTSCKTQKQYTFKPGDTVKVRNVRFVILDYNTGRKSFYYTARDLKRGYFVEYFPQAGLNVKKNTR